MLNIFKKGYSLAALSVVAATCLWSNPSLAGMSDSGYSIAVQKIKPVSHWLSQSKSGTFEPWSYHMLMKSARGPNFGDLYEKPISDIAVAYCHQTKAANFVAKDPSSYAKVGVKGELYPTERTRWASCDEESMPSLIPVFLWVTAPYASSAPGQWEKWVSRYNKEVGNTNYPVEIGAKQVTELRTTALSFPTNMIGLVHVEGFKLTPSPKGGKWYTANMVLRYPSQATAVDVDSKVTDAVLSTAPTLKVPVQLDVELLTAEDVKWAERDLVSGLMTKYNLLAIAEYLSRIAPSINEASTDGWRLLATKLDSDRKRALAPVIEQDSRATSPTFERDYPEYSTFRTQLVAHRDSWNASSPVRRAVLTDTAFLGIKSNRVWYDANGSFTNYLISSNSDWRKETADLVMRHSTLNETTMRTLYLHYKGKLFNENLLGAFSFLGLAILFWLIKRLKDEESTDG